jgi:hypothetical protein
MDTHNQELLYSYIGLSLILTREVVYMEMPIEPNEGQSGADVLWCMFENTNAGFKSFPVRENFCPESNYSSLTAFSHKRNPASCGHSF